MRRSPYFFVRHIVNATGGILRGSVADEICEGVSTDSRHIVPGNLFVALRGDTYDGHDFAAESVNSGATAILVGKDREDILRHMPRPVPVIMVDDTLTALGDIARFWRMQFSVPVIAVTGSSGKTTTKEMAASILGRTMNVLKSKGNFNNLVGLPLSLLEMHRGHGAAIVEMGTNHHGEIRKLAGIARPTVGVVTNVGPAHLEGFGTIDAIGKEKISLLFNLEEGGTAIVNADDEVLGKYVRALTGRVVTFGIRHSADVRARAIETRGAAGIRFSLEMGGITREVFLSLLGTHNVYNALAASAAAGVMGAGPDEVCEGLREFRPPSGRMNVTRLKRGIYLVDDTYNANPVSMKEALETVQQLRGQGCVFAIMGDMLELGKQAEVLHEGLGALCVSTGVCKLLHCGAFSAAVVRGARKAGFSDGAFIAAVDPDEVAAELIRYVEHGDWILVKGSRKMKMERYVEAIIRKIGIEESKNLSSYLGN